MMFTKVCGFPFLLTELIWKKAEGVIFGYVNVAGGGGIQPVE